MPGHREKRFLPHSAEQMFDLVADVGRYAEFLPWVTAVRVRSDSDTEMIADLIVGFRSLRERFTSKVVKDRANTINVEYLDGPLKFLRNEWRFEPAPGGCTVDFAVEFANILDVADEVILLPIYPARELPIEGVTSELILKIGRAHV